MTRQEGEDKYAEFFRTQGLFEEGLIKVLKDWPHSCEHNLTNENMNRIAWLGQAAMCVITGIPSSCRAGYNLLTEVEQEAADDLALIYLNKWLKANGYEETDGKRKHKTADIY
jgi:hypothetical protein